MPSKQRRKAPPPKRPEEPPPPTDPNGAPPGSTQQEATPNEVDRFFNLRMEEDALAAVLVDDGGLDASPEMAKARFGLLVATVKSSGAFGGDKTAALFEAMYEVLEEGLDLVRLNVERALKTRVLDLDPKYLDNLTVALPINGVSDKTLAEYGVQIRADHFQRLRLGYPAKARVIVEKKGLTPDQRTEEMRKLAESLVDDEKKSGTEALVVMLSGEFLEKDPAEDIIPCLMKTADGEPVLQQGIVAMLAGRDGGGKGLLISSWCVCIATGTSWPGPGGWTIAVQGRVLYCGGEETRKQMKRRINFAARAAGLTSEEDRDKIAANVELVPLRGQATRICRRFDPDTPIPQRLTDRGREIHDMIARAAAEGRPYVAVFLDPLSRFGPPEVEKNPEVATDYVQVCEYLIGSGVTDLPPTLVNSHHGGKGDGQYVRRSKLYEQDPEDLIRGSTAIRAAHRWAAVLARRLSRPGTPQLTDVVVVKSSYTAVPPPLSLCRAERVEGILRPATLGEVAAWENSAPATQSMGRRAGALTPEEVESASELKIQKAMSGMQRELAKCDLSRNALAKKLKCSRDTVSAAAGRLSGQGLLTDVGSGPTQKYHLLPQQQRSPVLDPEPGDDEVPGPAQEG